MPLADAVSAAVALVAMCDTELAEALLEPRLPRPGPREDHQRIARPPPLGTLEPVDRGVDGCDPATQLPAERTQPRD